MNKKRFFVIALFLCAASFANAQMVGNDEDKHGCKASAGYTYSAVLKECIQIHTQSIKLEGLSADTKGFTGTIIFSKDKKQAEVFVREASPSIY